VPAQADEALKSGLVDVVVPTADAVLPAAKALALDIARGTKPKVQSLRKGDKLPNMMVRRAGWQAYVSSHLSRLPRRSTSFSPPRARRLRRYARGCCGAQSVA